MQQQNDISDNVLIALRKIIQAIDLNSKRLVKQVGLTGPQLVILHYISSTKEISVGDVAKNVSLSQGTVTGILERMEKRGLVIRKRSSHDKRRVMVSITEPGKELLAKAPPCDAGKFFKEIQQDRKLGTNHDTQYITTTGIHDGCQSHQRRPLFDSCAYRGCGQSERWGRFSRKNLKNKKFHYIKNVRNHLS